MQFWFEMEGADNFIVVDRVLSCEDTSNYALEENEYEVPVKGRTHNKRSRLSAHLKADGTIRIDDSDNVEFWASLKLPSEYIRSQYHRLCKESEETEKRRKLYLDMKKEVSE